MTVVHENLPPEQRLLSLLSQLGNGSIDQLSRSERTRLLDIACWCLDGLSIDDRILLRTARIFPELTVEMLERGANGQAIDAQGPSKPGVVQYLLDGCTSMADTHGASNALDWMRRAMIHAYPCPNPAVILDILGETERNPWLIPLLYDAMEQSPQAAQEILEAGVRFHAPPRSMMEMAIDKGGDLFALFDPGNGETRMSVIDFAQTHPQGWVVDMFNSLAALQQSRNLQDTVGDASASVIRRRI